MKLFQFALLWHPTEEQKKEGKKSHLIPTKDTETSPEEFLRVFLAPDEKSAIMICGRFIPAQYLDQLEQIEVALRPF